MWEEALESIIHNDEEEVRRENVLNMEGTRSEARLAEEGGTLGEAKHIILGWC